MTSETKSEMVLHLDFSFPDNTASVLTRRNGFRRQEQSVYYLPIFIVDSGSPSLSSTNTLTIRVCDCDADGVAQTCNAEAYVLPAGLSTGALVAILACALTLLGECRGLAARRSPQPGGRDFLPISTFARTYENILFHAILAHRAAQVNYALSRGTSKIQLKENISFIFKTTVKIKGLSLKLKFFKVPFFFF